MVFSEAIRDYGEYARHEAGHTRTTLFTYLSWQRNFARWLEENGHRRRPRRTLGCYREAAVRVPLSPRPGRACSPHLRRLAVLIFGGLRRQELLDLPVPAINLSDQSLLVQQGKGQKSRTIYLCDEALVALREWLAHRPTLKCSHDHFFVSEGKRPFCPGRRALPQ